MNTPYNFHAERRNELFSIIFGTHSIAGRNFDIALLITIVVSVVIAMLDSVGSLHDRYGAWFFALEWMFTVLFCIEYGLRLYCAPAPLRYACSFYGIVDLLSIMPLFIALIFTGANYFIVIRLIRVLRVFRVLKLFSYITESTLLIRSLLHSRRKILVFFSSVFVIATVLGAMMYLVEGEQSGFDSIPEGIYWAIVTITTVGYGDITPHTGLGKALAAVTMLLGYAIIAIPTGIVTAELSHEMQRQRREHRCQNCGGGEHDIDAKFCKHCGSAIPSPSPRP